MNEKPYISVIAASRNDDHGGNPLRRTQIFVDGFLEQCRKYKLQAELIIVDWNPPSDRPPLHEVISWKNSNEYTACRVITVPPELHDRVRYSDRFSFFQMIAKNVGIKRAKGEFVLATNIDILFSDELMQFIAGRNLKKGQFYRCDRVDIHTDISVDFTLDEKMQFCKNEANIVRWNRRMADRNFLEASRYFRKESKEGAELEILSENAPFDLLNKNACGDFTMLHSEDWEKIHGYAEMESYSLHIDSLGVISANRNGLEEVSLVYPLCCYHVEHSVGSGWTPEGEKKLFQRLEQMGVSIPDIEILEELILRTESEGKKIIFNDEKWGFSEAQLPEVKCFQDRTVRVPIDETTVRLIAERKIKLSIKVEFDWDQIAQSYLRRLDKESLQIYRSISYYRSQGEYKWLDGRNVYIEFDSPHSKRRKISLKFEFAKYNEIDSMVCYVLRHRPCRLKIENISFIIKNGEKKEVSKENIIHNGIEGSEWIDFYHTHGTLTFENLQSLGIVGWTLEGEIELIDTFDDYEKVIGFMIEADKYKRENEALRKENERYRRILNTFPLAQLVSLKRYFSK